MHFFARADLRPPYVTIGSIDFGYIWILLTICASIAIVVGRLTTIIGESGQSDIRQTTRCGPIIDPDSKIRPGGVP